MLPKHVQMARELYQWLGNSSVNSSLVHGEGMQLLCEAPVEKNETGKESGCCHGDDMTELLHQLQGHLVLSFHATWGDE